MQLRYFGPVDGHNVSKLIETLSDLKDIPDNIKADLTIKTVKWIDEVLAIALTKQPTPLADDVVAATAITSSEEGAEERVNTH